MGVLSSGGGEGNSHNQSVKNVLGRQSFEEHCDEFLLGSNRSNTTEKKDNSVDLVINPFKAPGCDNSSIPHDRAHNPLSSSSSSISSSEERDEDKSLSNSNSVSNSDSKPFESVDYVASDEESAISEDHGSIMHNLQPQRRIGGLNHGKIVESQGMLNGFEDYTLYIKLLIVELKILLMPIYK